MIMEDSFPKELWRPILSRLSFREQVQLSSVSLLWYNICQLFCQLQTKLVIFNMRTSISSISCNFEEYHATHAIQKRDVIRISRTSIPVLNFFEKYCPNITVVSSNVNLGKKESLLFNRLLGKYSSQLKCINLPYQVLGSNNKPNLIHLKAHSLTQDSFEVLVTNSKFLTSFILEGSDTLNIFSELHRLPKGLKKIKINCEGHALPEGFLRSPAMNTIEHMTLLDVFQLPVNRNLISPQLKSLQLELTSEANEMQSQCIIRYLSYLPQLEELTLITRKIMFPLDSDNWKHLWQTLDMKLRVIVIKGNLIPGKLIPDLVSRCPLLQQLDVEVYVKVEEEDLLSLKELTKLEKLHVTLSRPNRADPVDDYPSPLVTWKRILRFLKESKSRDTLQIFSFVQDEYPIQKQMVMDVKKAVEKELQLLKDQHHLKTAYAAVNGYSVWYLEKDFH